MRTVLALAVLLALAAPARAGNDVGVVVTGEGTAQTQVSAQLENWLSQHGHRLVQTPLPPDAFPLLDDCFVMNDPKACVRAIIEQRAKSNTTVYARVKSTNNVTNGTRDVTLTAYWFDRGRDGLAETTTCERCTDELLRSTADDVMKKLASNVVGQVKLRSNPPGAFISIDGAAPSGVTPLNLDLPVGKHTIRLTKPDHEPASREVAVASDKPIDLVMDLEPIAGRSRILPYSLIGGGLLVAAAGGLLIAIDEDDVPTAPPRIYDTAVPGVVCVAVGAAAAIAGGVYLWLGSSKEASTPVVAVTGDAAYVGWLGRF